MDDSIRKKIDTHHPHDSFFQKAMSDIRVARDFIKAHVPKEILNAISLSRLELQPRIHIKGIGEKTISDLVYKTKVSGGNGYLYLTIEHQSRNDPIMAFRVLRYVVEIMETEYKATKKFPLVIPLVVYHGKSSCNMSNDLSALINAPKKLVDTYFLKQFQIIDLTKMPDQALAKHQHAALMELALKSTYREGLQYVVKIIDVYKKESGLDYESGLSLVLDYLLVSNRNMDRDQFFNTVREKLPINEDHNMLTVAEQLIEQGIEQGIEKGIEQGIEQGRKEAFQEAESRGKTVAEQLIEQGIERGIEKGDLPPNSWTRTSNKFALTQIH